MALEPGSGGGAGVGPELLMLGSPVSDGEVDIFFVTGVSSSGGIVFCDYQTKDPFFVEQLVILLLQ